VIRLPAVPLRISVSFVPALNTVAVRSFVVSSEKKLLVRQFHRVKTLKTLSLYKEAVRFKTHFEVVIHNKRKAAVQAKSHNSFSDEFSRQENYKAVRTARLQTSKFFLLTNPNK
jgi:hypothetical protein